jgi:hypothetical protein
LDKYSDSKYINEVNKIMAYSKNELKRFEQ